MRACVGAGAGGQTRDAVQTQSPPTALPYTPTHALQPAPTPSPSLQGFRHACTPPQGTLEVLTGG